MSTPKPVLAICVNWNGGDMLAETVESLLRSDYHALDIMVVDNASSDRSLSRIPGSVGILRLQRNVGYGGALNEAIRPLLAEEDLTTSFSRPTYFLILNNDLIVHRKTISALVQFAETKGPAVYGPRVVQYEHPDRLEAAWGTLSWSHVLAHYRAKGAPKNRLGWSRPKRVDLLLGSCLLVHRQVFEGVGLFDARFFMYHEEVDFLYRVRRWGFPIYFFPQAEVLHRGASSTQKAPLRRTYWIRRNTVWFLRKHRASLRNWCFYFATLVLSLLFNAFTLQWARLTTIWRAVSDGFLSTSPEKPNG